MDPTFRRQLWNEHKIFVSSVDEPQFSRGTYVEACTSFSRQSVFRATLIGSFSYFGKRVDIANTSTIGRYCSFGEDILVGSGPHPVHWLSSSNMFFRRPTYAEHPDMKEFFEGRDIPRFAHGKALCEIGNDVWCGSKAMVMMGVKVGTGAVIGGGAVVTKDVPPYAIVAGNPARIIRLRFDEDMVERLLASEWWEVKPALLKAVDVTDPEKALDQIAALKANEDWRYRPDTVLLGT